MKKALPLLIVLIVTIPLGYFFRGAFGREATFWLVGGLGSLAVILKGVQFLLQRYVKAQEAKMSLEERREFEKFTEEHR